jgi:hypothetical protein
LQEDEQPHAAVTINHVLEMLEDEDFPVNQTALAELPTWQELGVSDSGPALEPAGSSTLQFDIADEYLVFADGLDDVELSDKDEGDEQDKQMDVD